MRIEHLGRHAFHFLSGSSLPDFLQGATVQAALLEKLPQGHLGDAEFPRALDEVEQVVPRGLGVGEEKLGNGAGMAQQELPVRAAVEALLNLLDHLSRGEFPMAGGQTEC